MSLCSELRRHAYHVAKAIYSKSANVFLSRLNTNVPNPSEANAAAER